MKTRNYYLAILLLLLPIMFFGQEPTALGERAFTNVVMHFNKKVKKVHITDECMGKNEEYGFNEKGYLTEEIYCSQDSILGQVCNSKVVYYYHKNFIEKRLQYSEDTLRWVSTYTFKNDRIVLYQEYHKDRNKINQVYRYFYNTKGQLIKEVDSTSNGISIGETIYSKNQFVTTKKSDYEKVTYTTIEKYDHSLNLTEKTFKIDDSIQNVEKIYHKKNKKIKEFYFRSKLSQTLIYEYDKHNNLIEFKELTGAKEECKTINTYKKHARLNSKTICNDTLVSEIFYDDKDNILKDYRYNTNDIYSYKNYYNDHGDLREAILFKNDVLLCNAKYEYEYWD